MYISRAPSYQPPISRLMKIPFLFTPWAHAEECILLTNGQIAAKNRSFYFQVSPFPYFCHNIVCGYTPNFRHLAAILQWRPSYLSYELPSKAMSSGFIPSRGSVHGIGRHALVDSGPSAAHRFRWSAARVDSVEGRCREEEGPRPTPEPVRGSGRPAGTEAPEIA